MEWLGKAIILNPTTNMEHEKSQSELLSDDTNSLKIVHMMKPFSGSFTLDGASSISDNIADIDFKLLGRSRKSHEFVNEDMIDQFTIELPNDNISLDPDVLQDIRIISNHRNTNIVCVDMKDYLQEDPITNNPTLCRVCACESKTAYPLFQDGTPNSQLIERIHQYLPIKIISDDNLPQQVCDTCSLKLDICHNFFISSAEADAKLRAQLLTAKQDCKLLDPPKLHQTLGDMGGIKVVDVQTIDGIKVVDVQDMGGIKVVDVEGNPETLKQIPFTEEVPNTESVMEMDLPLINQSSFAEMNKQIVSCVPPSTPNLPCEIPPLQKTAEKEVTDTPNEQIESPNQEIDDMPNSPAKHTFSCQYCDKEFKTKVHKLKHERIHSKRKTKVICFVCEEALPTDTALRTHLKSEHKETKVFPCDLCDKTYSLLSSLDIHRSTHSQDTPYLCDLCGKKFKHVSNLRSHKRSHLDDSLKKRYLCSKCPKTFHSKFQLSEHMNVHDDAKPYPCEECGKRFHRRIQLRQHLITHSEEPLHECPQCGLRFNRKGNMTTHLKRHGHEKVFFCKVCKNSFPNMAQLLAHRRQEHKEEGEPPSLDSNGNFLCKTCSETFNDRDQFAEHLKVHGESLDYECSICNKKLKTKRSLEYHIRSFHTRVKLFSCKYCSEAFVSNKACTIHERIHTGERPYQCDQCDMAFRCSNNLVQHLLSHSDKKPWSCDHCKKTFKRKATLINHKRSHTGERPFCCDKCGRRFSQRNDMMRHQRSHCVNYQPFVCDDCGLSFKDRRSLNKHAKDIHFSTVSKASAPPVSILSSEAVVIATSDGSNIETPFPISVVDGIILHHVDGNAQPIAAEHVFTEASSPADQT